MKFYIDECLSPTYVDDLARRGYADTVHPMHVGMLGKRDDLVVQYALDHDRIIITLNARDFRRYLAEMPLHPGAIIIEGRGRARGWQRILAALAFIEVQPRPADYMVNRVVEVSADSGVRPYLHGVPQP